MITKKFRTQNNIDEFDAINFEPVDDTCKVETAGYLTNKQRIDALINAGQRLVAERQARYDFDGTQDLDESYVDPTRMSGFDIIDAQDALNAISPKSPEVIPPVQSEASSGALEPEQK